MKKLIVIGIIAMMITGLSVAANAFAGTVLQIDAEFPGLNYQPIFVGWYTDKGDGSASLDTYDGSDLYNGLSALPGQLRMNLGTISGTPSDQPGAATPCGSFVAPNIPAGELTQTTVKRWVITAQVESNPDHIGGTFNINAGFGAGFEPVDGIEFYILAGALNTTNAKAAVAANNYIAKLTDTNTSFTGGNFVLPAPTSTQVWNDMDEVWETQWGPNPTLSFTILAQGGPTSPVPEPGSMLAMFSGLVGLVGFGIRRRK